LGFRVQAVQEIQAKLSAMSDKELIEQGKTLANFAKPDVRGIH
jgi:hypothetical protein